MRAVSEPHRHRICALTRSLVVALALAGPARALEDPALRSRTTLLDNGLTVLTLEDHTTPVASLQLWVKVGSRDEGWLTGLAHLFEHMMFKGSRRVGHEAHARLVQSRGGRLNAYTSRDVTVYFEDVPAEALPLVIELEAERFGYLDISESTLLSEREVVREERRLRTDDDPQGRAYESLLALAFKAHPYRHPVIGWASDIEATTVEACRKFFSTYYAPNNIVLVVAGDFDTAETVERIRKAFGSFEPAREIPRNATLEPEQRGERRATIQFDLRGPILAAAWHAPATGHPDAAALDVAGEILSSGRSSRLYRRLVYQAQQALSARAHYWELQDAGLFYAFASVRPEASISRVEALLFEEIGGLRSELVSEQELSKAKRQLEVSLVNGLRTNHALAARIAQDVISFGRIRPLDERLAEIQAVSAEDVRRVASTYLVDDKRTVVRVVPPGASEPAAGAP